jgi:phenylacetic acid degradation operon negative regulatory protein
LIDLVEEQGVGRQVLIMDARIAEPASIPELAHSRWRLPELGKRYRHFVDDFEAVAGALPKRAAPQLCFVVRTLLIHEYRRILLTDPDLPDALLPDAWPGRRAAELTKALYFAVAAGSTEFVMGAFENAAGALPKPAAEFFRRFAAQGDSSTSIRSKPRKRTR